MDKNKIATFTPPDGGYGWIVVLATTLINISVLPLFQCFGIIYKDDFSAMQVSDAKTAFLVHLYSAIYCILGLLGSPLLKKYDFRRVALLGTSLMCLGIFLSSFGKSYGALIFTFSILTGIGHGVMLPATYLATNTYFKKRLTLAVSLSVTGASISNIFMPQICRLLLQHLSTQHTVLVLSAISVVAIACSFLLKPINTKTDLKDHEDSKTLQVDKQETTKEEKEELEMLNRDNQVYNETTMPVLQKTIAMKIYDLFNLELLNNPPYVVTIIGMSISFASESNIILMIAFMLPNMAGFSPTEVAWFLSVQSIADIFGRLVVPLIGHCFDVSPKIMYANSLITSTVGRTVMAVFNGSRPTFYFCACLLGLGKGIKAVYQSVIIPKYVALEKLPAANGLNMLLTGAASLAIGPLIGAIRDETQSYKYALHTGSILSMSCMLLWILFFTCYERKKTENVIS